MKRLLAPVLLLPFLSLAIAKADSTVRPGGSLTGHYMLIAHAKGVDALDGIDFHADKTCTVEYDGSTGLPGSYEVNKNGSLTILVAGGEEFTYLFRRLKVTMLLSQHGQDDLYYGLLPDPPAKLEFKDVLGAYYLRDTGGEETTEITADHKYRMRGRYFLQDGTYSDVAVDGTCSYANGVITYVPVHSNQDQTYLAMRDLVVKHDEKGLWVVDAANDAVMCETPSKNLDSVGTLAGHYLLIEHDKDIDALDGIEFHPDGTCKVDYGGSTGVSGTYNLGGDGNLTITLDNSSQAFTYAVKRQKVSMVLSRGDHVQLYYALLPDSPPPFTFNDVVGIVDTSNSLGDYATEITAAHRFRDHIRYFDPQAHTYFDLYTSGTCAFANGIVTYWPEQSLGTQAVDFIKDVLVKHGANGLWVIDPFDDTLLRETHAKDLNFPAPPDGYHSVSPP